MVSLKNNLGTELMWQTDSEDIWNDHAPLLFPVCGQLKDKGYSYNGVRYDMSSHGFAKRSKFILTTLDNDKILFELRSNEETRKIYPFDFILYASYELCDKDVIFSVTVKNLGKDIMPFMFGWHPGFVLPCNENCDIENYKILFGDYQKVTWTPLQNGCFARPYGEDYKISDGAYTLCEKEIYDNDTMIFSDCGNSIKLFAENQPFSLLMSWSDNLPYLCVWKEPENSAKFICLEPWTGTPNNGEDEENFNSRKMERINPGESAIYTYKLNFNW